MRLVTFAYRGETRIGAQLIRGARSTVLDFSRALPDLPTDMIQFLRAGEYARALAQRATADPDAQCLIAEEDVILLAPIPKPEKIICVGHNYFDHISGAGAPDEYPVCFGKFANVVTGHKQPIVYPPFPIKLDYEGELAVVIGKRARNIEATDALEVVAGYTIFNDVTARDYQPHASQWSLRKSFDTFGPMGPALVTSDEVPDPGNLDLRLTVNGVERQRSNTRHLIFSIPFLIAYLTRTMTLEPGDVISTGTPSGTGASLEPPIFLQPGDIVRVTIERIGELANPVVAKPV